MQFRGRAVTFWHILQRTVVCPVLFLLVLPASTNYQLQDYSFNSGGFAESQSTNYAVLVLTGEPGDLRLVGQTYQTGAGLIFTNQANVPIAPSVVNDANYTNKLHITLSPGSDASDTTYLIAISPDNFATTTNYIQNDNTIGVTGSWQTYAAWGGASGFLVLGLAENTTYTIKVKSRQGSFTETDYGPTASAATIETTISFSINGVASGTTIEGITTDLATTSSQIPFGELALNQRKEAAQQLVVSTSAAGGYTARVNQVGELITPTNITFPGLVATNVAPASWPGSIISGAYGYHTSDASLGTGTTNRFTADDTYAKFETTAREIAYAATSVTEETTTIVFAIEAGGAQPAGDYTHTVTYTVYGSF